MKQRKSQHTIEELRERERMSKNNMVRFSTLTLVVVFLSCVASSYAANVADPQTICKKAKDPSFCLNFLKSKPGGVGGDLNSLLKYTLGVLRTNVSGTISLITKLIAQSGNDLEKKNYYKSCLTFYAEDEGALGEIEEAQDLLNRSDYNGVNVHISGVMSDVYNCRTGDGHPYQDISSLPKQADVVNNVAEIILIISNLLLNH